MKFQVLVLDYDGTVASDGRLDPDVRAATVELRVAGVNVVLATGRILDDLEHVAGDLGVFDAVVAENGAVVTFPAEDRSLLLGHEPPRALLDALNRRCIPFVAGQCVIEADAVHAPVILEAIREHELSLTLTFNRARVMVLPQGITKATGLHEALRLLRRSEHNAIAIGDAENDHPLLEACELGIAVGWGSPSLKSGADAVLDGEGPPDVASYLRTLAKGDRLPWAHLARRQVLLGHTKAGQPVSAAIRGRNILIAGDAKSGKSYVAGLLAEQLIIQRYAVCVIDPEGDYRSLESLPGLVMVGGSTTLPHLHALDHLAQHPEFSMVLDLSAVGADEKYRFVAGILPRLAATRRRYGVPHRIILDEAHYFLPQHPVHALLDPDLGAYTLVTYRLTDLHPAVRAASPVLISTRLTNASEVAALRSLGVLPDPADRWVELLGNLKVGDAVLLRGGEGDAEAGGEPMVCWLAPRRTTHVRHRQKYLDVPVVEASAFVFSRAGVATEERARSLGELVAIVRRLPADVVAGHLQRGDYSRWVADVFGDQVLAAQIRALECRGPAALPGEAGTRLARLIERRYLPADNGRTSA